jgi:hypothetical protein
VDQIDRLALAVNGVVGSHTSRVEEMILGAKNDGQDGEEKQQRQEQLILWSILAG